MLVDALQFEYIQYNKYAVLISLYQRCKKQEIYVGISDSIPII